MAGTRIGRMRQLASKTGLSLNDVLSRYARGMKWCWKCQDWRDASVFNKDASRWDGLAQECRTHRMVTVRKTTKGRPSAFKGRRHTQEARRKISESKKGKPGTHCMPHTEETKARLKEIGLATARRGPASPNWKGGLTDEHTRIRASSEYSDWRNAVFSRDNFTCLRCGDDRGGNLRAHHRWFFADHPDLRFDVNNGETLCNDCHEKNHIEHPCECGQWHYIRNKRNNERRIDRNVTPLYDTPR